jgi:DNA polymerase-3 subunit delta
VFYIFHGDDGFSQGEELARLRDQLADGDPTMGDLNTTVLAGERLTLGELRQTCDAIPFMASRRLVIVRGLLARLAPRRRGGAGTGPKPSELSTAGEARTADGELLKQLASYLVQLPATTRLIFVENETLAESHPILRLAQAEHEQGRAHIRHYKLPWERDLPAWIRKRAADKGGTLGTEAVRMLADLVGNRLAVLDLEIDKLLLYADGRQVTSEDVVALVGHARETDIFDLVDCVGRRQAGQALTLLHHMLEDGAAPLYVLAMLARQIRILIQIAELQQQRLTPKEIARRLRLHPYAVDKGLAQARSFELAQLESAHERLVQADWAIKTGECDEVLALDLLVAVLTHI